MSAKSIFALCFAFLFAVVVARSAESGPIASTTAGQVQGQAWSDGTGAAFKGIPFAEPPVGNLRWRGTMPVKSWQGVRAADTAAPACAQADAGWNSRAAQTGKEDCLYLNVWTPTWPAKSRLPVFVWIHGGGNAGGGGGGALVNGESLSRHGIVVVTIQYRLGIFGFLALPGLTKESPHHSSGDYGILDQLEALKWVKANIAQFGGDPDQITVGGQSAGAHDTGLLLTSPLSKGLISRAIEESGTVVINGANSTTLADAEQNGLKLVSVLKPPDTNSLGYLRGLSTEDVLKAEPPYGGGGIGPNVDGYVIPRQPAETFASHQELHVPLLIGNNAREMTLAGGPDELTKAIQTFYGPLAPAALDFYGVGSSGTPQSSNYPPYGSANSQWATDKAFRCSTLIIANSHSDASPTYEYEYSHALPGREADGATHSAELGYVFGTLSMGKPVDLDRKISADVQLYWTNFVKTGNPNDPSLPEWPKHDATSQKYLEFTDAGPVAKQKIRNDICPLFEKSLKNKAAH